MIAMQRDDLPDRARAAADSTVSTTDADLLYELADALERERQRNDTMMKGMRMLNGRIRVAKVLCTSCDIDCADPECSLARAVLNALNPG